MRGITLFFALVVCAPVVGVADELDQCVAALQPSAEEEAWRKIPWRADLLEARREANEQGKPIFMWIMNGSPLGCT